MKSYGGLLFSAGIDIRFDFIINHSAFGFDFNLAQELCIHDRPNAVCRKMGEEEKGQRALHKKD